QPAGASLRSNKKPSGRSERVANWLENLCRAHDVTRLKPLRAFQQIELDGLTLVQRAVTVLLDGREMHEHILARGALDKSISFRPVEPLHSTLLSHKETPFDSSLRIILSPLVCLPCLPANRYRTHPLPDTRYQSSPSKTVRIQPTSPRKVDARTKRNGSPVFRRTVARDKILWSRENEGAISDR